MKVGLEFLDGLCSIISLAPPVGLQDDSKLCIMRNFVLSFRLVSFHRFNYNLNTHSYMAHKLSIKNICTQSLAVEQTVSGYISVLSKRWRAMALELSFFTIFPRVFSLVDSECMSSAYSSESSSSMCAVFG